MLKGQVLIAAACLALLSSCSGGGAKMETKQDIKTTTTGQELMDLQKAYESGAISKEEYEDQREKILENQ